MRVEGEPALVLPGPDPDAPGRLAELHRARRVGECARIDAAGWPPPLLQAVIEGAGFSVVRAEPAGDRFEAQLRRERTLADSVGPDMVLLTVGLNPSLYAADMGVGFGRPGNRFWPAASAAGLVHTDRDPGRALHEDGLGMTDLVKRATARADELDGEEYRRGMARLEQLVTWLAPRAVCFVGLAGWRAAVDRKAVAGRQPALWGVPVYLMPSTSGLNAHASLDVLTDHLRAARSLAD